MSLKCSKFLCLNIQDEFLGVVFFFRPFASTAELCSNVTKATE